MKKRAKNQKRKQKSLTNLDLWRPNPRQILMVELLINPEDRRTKEDKCKEVGVKKQTLYNWLKKPEFVTYMNSQIDKYTNSELSEVWKALLLQCRRGNIEAIKLFFKMKELDPDIQIKREELKIRQKESEMKAW
jgi:hypothetical protein